MADDLQKGHADSLDERCPFCTVEMRLVGMDSEYRNETYQLYTFVCSQCGRTETKSVTLN